MTIGKRLAAGIAGLGLGLTLAACDRADERLDRLGEIQKGVLDQLSGGDGGTQSSGPDMSSVPVEARAFQGEMAEPSPVRVASGPGKFVVGSIVAKPRNLPEPISVSEAQSIGPSIEDYDNYAGNSSYAGSVDSEAVLVVPSKEELQELESATRSLSVEKPARLERAIRKRTTITINPDSQQQTAQALPRAPLEGIRQESDSRLPQARITLPDGIDTNEGIVAAGPELPAPAPREVFEAIPEKLAQRRIVMKQEAMRTQLDAESRMIETAQRYGMAANIQRSRSGQMVIEVGSRAMKPTKYGGPDDNETPWIAEDDETLTCPEGVSDEVIAEDALLATVCVIQDLQNSGEFEYVEKDWIYQNQFVRRPKDSGPMTAAAITPNDPLWSLQWNFLNQSSVAGAAGFVDFWTKQASQGSSDVVVAVVDTGLEMEHPDIKNSPNVAPGWDMVTDIAMANDGDSRDSDPNDPGDECPEEFVFEDTFHGTHVAGTIGAGITNNSSGVAGGAWNVKIVPVRALGKCGGRLSDINDAIRWAGGLIPEYDELGNEVWNENPADIINLSLGLFRTCPASMQDAINEVTERGVVVVAAAGNDAVSTQYYAPGGCANVVSVAAGDARGQIAPYSNYGAEVDVLAPGGDLQRDDNGDGRPDGILSTKHASNCVDPVTNSTITDCYYAYEQGTSMAAPHVSAALALIKSKRTDLSGTSLSDVLIAALNPRNQEQCSGPCDQYPGAEEVSPGSDMCKLPCGGGLLNLSDVNLGN